MTIPFPDTAIIARASQIIIVTLVFLPNFRKIILAKRYTLR